MTHCSFTSRPWNGFSCGNGVPHSKDRERAGSLRLSGSAGGHVLWMISSNTIALLGIYGRKMKPYFHSKPLQDWYTTICNSKTIITEMVPTIVQVNSDTSIIGSVLSKKNELIIFLEQREKNTTSKGQILYDFIYIIISKFQNCREERRLVVTMG